MTLTEVRRVIALGEPTGFSIGHLTERSKDRGWDLFFLPLDRPDLKTRISRGEEDLMTMKTKEGVCRVFSSYFFIEKDGETAWMEIGEFGEVEDFAVDDDPEIPSFVVLRAMENHR